MRCLVAGGGGFISGHLVNRLLNDGHSVKAVDIKSPGRWWQMDESAWNVADCDLSLKDNAFDACKGMDWVFNLAADMGGIGFIENHKAACMLSVLINTHLLAGAKWHNVKRYFYSSSACVYHADVQNSPDVTALKEEDAYYRGGAMPEDGYGWEKLFSERMCRHFREDYGLETRVARFHNIYGPMGSWNDGREKAPAALCRKVAEAKRDKETAVDVWGDGTLTRSFCYVDDCVEGVMRLMKSDYPHPINIGSDELVTINQLLGHVEDAAEYGVIPKYDLTKPQGVAGRNSDNTLCRKVLDWAPSISLSDGIDKTYPWIEKQVLKQ